MTVVIEKFNRLMEIRNLAQGTRTNYLNAVNAIQAHYHGVPLETLTDDDVQKYLHFLAIECKHSKSHVNVQAAGLRFFFKYVLKKDLRDFLIPISKKPKKLPDILSRQEVGRLFQTIGYDLRKTAFFTVLYGCGLRGDEACRLRIRDVDREDKRLWVRGGKGNKDRGIYMPKAVYTALAKYWKACKFSDYFFVRTRNPNAPMRIETARGWFKCMQREAGIKKSGGLHLFRHSYATHNLEDGESLLVIQKNMGHTSLRTTQIYLQLARCTPLKVAPVDRLFDSMAFDEPEW